MSYLDSEYPGPLPENIAIATASLTSDEIDPRRGDSPPSRFYQDDEQDIGKHEEDEDNQEDVYDEESDDKGSATGVKSPVSETYTEEEQEEFLADRRESYSSDDAEDEFNPEFPDSKSMSELFEYITVYTPESFDLETKLLPFIPGFIPCIGDIDAFIKFPRPDLKPDTLGLVELDEPSLEHYTDPRVLDLQLRSLSKSTRAPHTTHSITVDESFTPKLLDWISKTETLHHAKPLPTVNYSKPFPDIEELMQAWPENMENALCSTLFPGANDQIGLEEYVRIGAALVDVPVYNESQTSLIESLHVIFTLYSAFRDSGHFKEATFSEAVFPEAVIAHAAEP